MLARVQRNSDGKALNRQKGADSAALRMQLTVTTSQSLRDTPDKTAAMSPVRKLQDTELWAERRS